MLRYLVHSIGSLLLTATLFFACVGAKDCNGPANVNANTNGGISLSRYAKYVQTGIRVLGKAKTIFAANGLGTDKLDTAIRIGNAGVAALNSGATNALELTADFIDAFEAIADDASLIKDATTRTIVMIGLAVGSEALHELSGLLQSDGAQADTARSARLRTMAANSPNAAQRIADFGKKPHWRCRNSITGQFAAMDYCKANPATSTVER